LGLVDLGELSVDVETLLDQLDLTDRRRLLGEPLLDLCPAPLEVGWAPWRHVRGLERAGTGARSVAHLGEAGL
jgi:hypothetical protein